MENYKLSVGFEPTDKYQKAKQDLLQAINSFRELDDTHKRRLLNDFFGAEKVAFMQELFYVLSGRLPK